MLINKNVYIIFLVILLVLGITGCNKNEQTTEQTDNTTPMDIILSEDYSIIYGPKTSTGSNKIYRYFKNSFNINIKQTSNTNNRTACEILVGDTGTDQSTAFINSLKEYEYGVRILRDAHSVKILISGKNIYHTLMACELFIDKYLSEVGEDLAIQKTEDTIMFDTDKQIEDSLTEKSPISWEQSNIFISGGGYARLIDIGDGKIACVYSSKGYMCMRTSIDDGKTWSDEIHVAKGGKTPTGDNIAVSNANMIMMKNGDYMFAFRAHTASSNYSSFYSSIRYVISKDQGKTWSEDVIVAENILEVPQGKKPSDYFSGFWEPHMLYIKDGKLAMYYANDCIGGSAKDYPFVESRTYQHIIVHIYDEEKEVFGPPIVASDGEKHNSRDGMPVVCQLSDGTYAMVIESTAMRNQYSFIIQILFSEDGITWSEPRTIHTPTVNGNYAGAPFIALLDDGRIAVSFQATQGSGTTLGPNAVNNSVMNVIVSKKAISYLDKDTIGISDFETTYPKPITPSGREFFSIWPALFVHKGNLYCLAQCANNTSSSSTTAAKLYLTIGKIK